MAIYSANHKTIGRSTHEAGTAGAHVRYITRDGAARLVIGEHMPTDRSAAAWIGERETADRKNARVCDKVLVALPIEFDAGQRADLVREFMAEFGGGRVSWMAGIHDKGEDAANPHAHILIRDKDHETGKRVFGTSEKGSTERIRELWETVTNRALEREGFEARIDRRSLAEQGIAREAGIHVGPNVEAMEDRGLRPVSIAQDHVTSRGNERVVNWPEIDQGRTRADRQREIKAGNLERDQARDQGKGSQEAQLVPVELGQLQHGQAGADAAKIHDAEIEADRRQAIADRARIAMERAATRWEVSVPVQQHQAEAEPAVSRTPDPIRELKDQVQGRDRVLGGDVKATSREAIQRASYEVQKPQPIHVPEISRMAEIVAAARAKLASLADRLETAWQRIMERQQQPAAPAALPVRDRAADRQQPEKARPQERDFADDLLAAARQRRQEQRERTPELERKTSHERPGRSLMDELRRPRKPGEPEF